MASQKQCLMTMVHSTLPRPSNDFPVTGISSTTPVVLTFLNLKEAQESSSDPSGITHPLSHYVTKTKGQTAL